MEHVGEPNRKFFIIPKANAAWPDGPGNVKQKKFVLYVLLCGIADSMHFNTLSPMESGVVSPNLNAQHC